MRASIPALFVVMTFLMKFFLDGNKGIRRAILIIVMIIGACTPASEICRSAALTSKVILREHGLLPENMTVVELKRNEVYSLGSIRTTDKEMIEGYVNHFLAFNYKDSFFFKYLSR